MARAKAKAVFVRSVCAIPFLPGEEGRVLLLRKTNDKDEPFYDGFSGILQHDPLDPMAGQKSCSEYVAAETGVLTKPKAWVEIVTLRGEEWEINYYYAIVGALANAKSLTENAVSLEKPLDLPYNIMPSLRWLIPLALDDGVVKPLGLSGIQL